MSNRERVWGSVGLLAMTWLAIPRDVIASVSAGQMRDIDRIAVEFARAKAFNVSSIIETSA